MSFEIKWFPKASQNLSKLPKFQIERIFKKLDEVKLEPFRFLEHFEGEKVYKLRIGDYRALVDVDFGNKILFIQVFDKRGRVYKR
ncbi:MAG: type II toxin-antitoxin system RelE/ParE family toxin [Nanoarchaeota archaeon]